MSSCRCTDIDKCKENIQKLEYAAEEIDGLATPYISISDKLDSLANTAIQAYDSETHNTFANEARNLKNDMREAMDSCQAAIGEAINKLRIELTEMEAEDEAYHAEEEEEEDPITTGTTTG